MQMRLRSIFYPDINPFQPIIEFHMEASHLICGVNQMTGFHMKCNSQLKWIERKYLRFRNACNFF